MERERFACNIYKIAELSNKTLTISIEAVDTRHKDEIIRKLCSLKVYTKDKKTLKRLIDFRLMSLTDDFVTLDMIEQ